MTHAEILRQQRTVSLVLPDDLPDKIDNNNLRSVLRRLVRAGMVTTFVFITAMAIWGFAVPLQGGAAAPGVMMPVSSKKTIQHLEGGILSEILVHENDVVRAGQPLVVIENIQERSSFDALEEERLSQLAKQARLDAERGGRDKVDWPPELRADTAQVHRIVEAQQQVFETQRAAHQARKSILRQRIEQLNEQIKGYNSLVDSATQQLAYIEEESAGKRALLERGLMIKPEYLQLQRTHAEISGRRGESIARIANARQTIGETQMQLLSADADRSNQIANEADKVRYDIATTLQRLRGSADVLKRTTVTAPIDGKVLNLKFKTIGGVIQRGEPIMEIIPIDDTLIVEARIRPLDVKAVHQGLSARVRLTTFSSRDVPPVHGQVESVSADRLLDQFTREPYYLARVSLDKHQLDGMASEVRLIPGMPVDVLIVVEQRTMFQYLFKPFRDAFNKSLLEL